MNHVLPDPPHSCDPLPLSVLWQALDQVLRHPEDLEAADLLQIMAQAIAPLPLAEQLAVAGFVFDQLAGVVNTRATLLLESWESWHRPVDPILDFSRDPDLFVQSQRLELSDLVDTTPAPVFYPLERKSPSSPDSAFDDADVTDDHGLEGLLSDGLLGVQAPIPAAVPTEPLSESDVLDTLRALSHGENIPLWSSQVSDAMRSLTQKQRRPVKALPLLTLQQSLQVPLVEVWLALLLGDSGYQLTRPVSRELEDFNAWADAFYSGASLQVEGVTLVQATRSPLAPRAQSRSQFTDQKER